MDSIGDILRRDPNTQRLMTILEAKRLEIRAKYGGSPPPPDPKKGDPCPDGCHGAGWVKKPYDPGDGGSTTMEILPCPKCSSGAAVANRRMEKLLRDSGLDGRDMFSFDSEWVRQWVEEHDLTDVYEIGCDYAMRPDGWLWICHSSGESFVGKTSLALCIANEWVTVGKRVLFRSVPDLLDEFRASFNEDGEMHYNDLMRHTMTVACLILDDYGKENSTPWAKEKLFQLSDFRMERGLPTVVTTNLTMPDLEARNVRLARRVADTTKCTVVEFTNDPIEQ